MSELVEFISSVGFPIVAFLLMFLRLEKTVSLLVEAVNNNTSAVQCLMKDQLEKK